MSVGRGFWAATWGVFVSLLFLLPGIAGGVTVAIYLVFPPELRGYAWLVAVIGPLLALLALFVIAAVGHGFARVGRANAMVATDLTTRLNGLRADRAAYCTNPQSAAATAACSAALGYETYIAERLESIDQEAAGLEWASGSGYVGLWGAMHRAEEALMRVAPDDIVVVDAYYDQSRLRGSSIAGQKQLLRTSRAALDVLTGATLDADTARALGVPRDLDKSAARGVLIGIRNIVNDYRDDLSVGLVHLRRRLNTSVIIIGSSGYIALALAILGGLGAQHVVAGAAFYLTGAFIGMVQVAYAERSLQSHVNDYGVSTARMVHLAMISGFVGAAGAVLAALLTIRPLGLALLDAPGTVDILRAFDLREYPAGLIVAAIFGLTPGLLFKKLREAGKSMTTALEKSSAGASGDAEEEDDNE